MLREDDTIPAVAHVAVEDSEDVYGTLGRSFLLNFLSFKPVSGVAFDYMHTLDLGVTKKLLELVFSSKHSNEAFSARNNLDQVNARINMLKFSQGLVSRIRPIGEPGWRAHEYRAFALYYGLSVIKDLCSSDIYDTFKLLNTIYFISLSSHIYQEDIDLLSRSIIGFLQSVERNFGEYWITINFHELIHIPQCISRIGPLQNFSAYGYKNLNRLSRISSTG